jgi:hypothetical protein
MENSEFAKIFWEISEFLELGGENPFKIRAYQKAARNIEEGGSLTIIGTALIDAKVIDAVGNPVEGEVVTFTIWSYNYGPLTRPSMHPSRTRVSQRISPGHFSRQPPMQTGWGG